MVGRGENEFDEFAHFLDKSANGKPVPYSRLTILCPKPLFFSAQVAPIGGLNSGY